ncbi:hypothetical protein KIF24_01845 [Micromonospora sp. Llam7]|uniref:hypothetical protein n=1 Tax=Micromonospora tarapacensis TaxID=2835305 RepID=UPI001C82A30E|nr:hypothetical protein [Micromonospora tarapacensis]MBX7264916.1 hypothetical protein [Micromonospora tarapacensis]
MAEISFPHEDYPDEGEAEVTEAEYASGIGWASPSGLFGSPSDPVPIYLSGGNLWLRAGVAARLCGVAYDNTTDLQIATGVTNGGAATRRDHVVVQLDWETMLARHAIITGVAGAALPAVTQQRGSGVFEISLGEVAIPAGGSLANASIARRGWYLGVDGEYVCTSGSQPPHALGRRCWETDTGRSIVSTGSQWIVTGDNAHTSLGLVAANWRTTRFNRIRRRNGSAYMTVTPQRVSGPLVAGQTSTLGTIPTGFRPIDDQEIVGHVVSSGAQVVGEITASTGIVTVKVWGGGIGTDRFMNLQAVSWPINY